MRFFNTAGPVNCNKHYCLPPLQRFNLPEILGLISQEKYFVLHAPRQTGKTTYLLALMDYLNREGRYRALYANFEAAQGARENVRGAMEGILDEISEEGRILLKDTALEKIAEEANQATASTAGSPPTHNRTRLPPTRARAGGGVSRKAARSAKQATLIADIKDYLL